MVTRKKVFISFDFDNDGDLKMLLANQSKLPDTPFDTWDSSVSEHMTGDWKAKVRAKLKNVDIVCVLCTTTTHRAEGVAIELEIAKEIGASYFLLKGYKDKNCYAPRTASSTDKMYDWTWPNLKLLIHGNR